MPARRRLAALLPLAGLCAGPGCVWYGEHSMTRVWADRNTLNRPAVYVERLAHAPPPRERVERFRWQYGVGPGTPALAPQPTTFVLPPAGPPHPAPGGPPPAPAPEPAGAAEASPPRSGVAWLFTPERS